MIRTQPTACRPRDNHRGQPSGADEDRVRAHLRDGCIAGMPTSGVHPAAAEFLAAVRHARPKPRSPYSGGKERRRPEAEVDASLGAARFLAPTSPHQFSWSRWGPGGRRTARDHLIGDGGEEVSFAGRASGPMPDGPGWRQQTTGGDHRYSRDRIDGRQRGGKPVCLRGMALAGVVGRCDAAPVDDERAAHEESGRQAQRTPACSDAEPTPEMIERLAE